MLAAVMLLPQGRAVSERNLLPMQLRAPRVSLVCCYQLIGGNCGLAAGEVRHGKGGETLITQTEQAMDVSTL